MSGGLSDLERRCLAAMRDGTPASTAHARPEEALLAYALSETIAAGARIRALRLESLANLATFKDDGSPVTRCEHEIEEGARARLAALDPDAVFVGEEAGGAVPASGVAVALDPIDGTWAFLNRTETCATSLTVYRDGRVIIGVVGNPATGEIGYVTSGGSTRLLQLGLFGEADQAWGLPLEHLPAESVLVNVHPHRHTAPVVGTMLDAWRADGLNMVRMSGGSPAWSLLDAAKGSFVYVNAWSRRPSAAYDLGAGLELVRGAGGEVVDLDGVPIPAVGHRGVFVAAVDAAARERVLAIVRSSSDL